MSLRFVFIWGMYVAIIFAVHLGPSGIGAYIDPISFLIVVGLTSFCLFFSFGPKKCFRMLVSALLLKAEKSTKEDVKDFIHICDAGVNAAMYSGGLGVLIGTIQMLQDLSDPNALGVGIATSLITLLYSFSFGVFIFLPAKYYFINILQNEEELKVAASRSTLFLPSFIFLPLGSLLFLALPFPHIMSEDQQSVEISSDYITFNNLQSHAKGTEGAKHLYIDLTIHIEPTYKELLERIKFRENVIRSILIEEMLKYNLGEMEGVKFHSVLKNDFKLVLDDFLKNEFSLEDKEQPVKALFFSKFLIKEPLPDSRFGYYY